MCLKMDFEVKVTKSEVVAAALPLQEHWLPLSNLDLLLPPVDFGVFFCYKETDQPFPHIVGLLKNALAQTLISYYAFAGVLVRNTAGENELLCNNDGVDFVEAVSDAGLEDLNLYNPDEHIGAKLVPIRKRGVLAVQVTHLRRGGVVVACTVAHQVADAYSANMFLISWAENARCEKLSQTPSFRRSLLLPRRPGQYDISVDNMFVLVPPPPPPPEAAAAEDAGEETISRIYYIKSDRIKELQEQANLGNSKQNRRTKLESFCAFLWKTIVSGEDFAGENKCKLGIVVDGRSRLIDGDCDRSKLIAPYFGNVLSIPFGENKIETLTEQPLNWVANEVHELLQVAATKEHFLGLIDWVEERRPKMVLAKIYAERVTEEEPAVVVSSGQQFPVGKMDFGSGLPVFGSYHFPWGGKSGYVMPMPSVKGDGDWIVYMHLLRGQLEVIERNACNVFNPLTCDYVFC